MPADGVQQVFELNVKGLEARQLEAVRRLQLVAERAHRAYQLRARCHAALIVWWRRKQPDGARAALFCAVLELRSTCVTHERSDRVPTRVERQRVRAELGDFGWW